MVSDRTKNLLPTALCDRDMANELIAGIDAAQPASISAENKGASTIAAGAPVTGHSSGVGVVKANASTGDCVGLAIASTAPSFAVAVESDGVLILSDWSAVTGTVSLAARADYFLDASDGLLTTTAPSIAGQFVQRVGRALSPTALEIDLWPSVLL